MPPVQLASTGDLARKDVGVIGRSLAGTWVEAEEVERQRILSGYRWHASASVAARTPVWIHTR
jgi:hypothetical protein